jgi:hypothetical protein
MAKESEKNKEETKEEKPVRQLANTVLHICGKTVEVVAGHVKNGEKIEEHVKAINKAAFSNADAALKKQLAVKESELEALKAENEALKKSK